MKVGNIAGRMEGMAIVRRRPITPEPNILQVQQQQNRNNLIISFNNDKDYSGYSDSSETSSPIVAREDMFNPFHVRRSSSRNLGHMVPQRYWPNSPVGADGRIAPPQAAATLGRNRIFTIPPPPTANLPSPPPGPPASQLYQLQKPLLPIMAPPSVFYFPPPPSTSPSPTTESSSGRSNNLLVRTSQPLSPTPSSPLSPTPPPRSRSSYKSSQAAPGTPQQSSLGVRAQPQQTLQQQPLQQKQVRFEPTPSTIGTVTNASTGLFPPPPKPGPNEIGVVIHEYRTVLRDELDLRVGELVKVHIIYDDGWAHCVAGGKDGGFRFGAFPMNCIRRLEPEEQKSGKFEDVKEFLGLNEVEKMVSLKRTSLKLYL
ncbi:UNVERIFIED_CONTAM: hypothetical protein HDU68_003342 [Siphonaria sp. JEL0065]|nr:hypothetical protein HDU68_003342 [Siphonaria sp. JEL0065]